MSKIFQGGVLYINGLPAAHAGPGGHANAKEECWVTVGGQKVKKVFINIAHSDDLQGTTNRIFVNGYPLATKSSCTSKSYGDGSSEGGVKTGTIEGKASFLTSSSNVTLEGCPAVRHGDVVISNAGNTELTTWVQPTTSAPAIANIESDPIENLSNPSALNIQLMRNPQYEFAPSTIQQSFSVTHDITGHKTCSTYGEYKSLEEKYLWHADYLREGTYTVHEFYPHVKGVMTIPLGKIKTVDKDNHSPGMKLVPLSFRRFDDYQGSSDQSKMAYVNSYIYLFKDGKIWRIFQINREERLYEKDLSAKNKEISIPTTAELSQGVLLPIEDAEGTHTFQVAVSYLPWSWEYIHLLGGIDSKDMRFQAEHQLGIAPDQTLIKERLQEINIHALINGGEICSAIPTNQTQDELLRGVHVCEPSKENKEWVVDRDRFKHSTGTVKFENNLYWHTESPPKRSHTPTLDQLRPEGQKLTLVPGSAVFLLHDPLGRLIFTAELMVNHHCKYLNYTHDNSAQYTVAVLAGQMIASGLAKEKPEDYTQHIDNEARLKLIKEYEFKTESYNAFMLEAINMLKFWFEASHEHGQWEDFRRNPDSKKEFDLINEVYQGIYNNIFSAFMLSPEGLAFLKEEVAHSNSKIWAEAERIKFWTNIEFNGQLIRNLGSVLAATLEPGSQSFSKIMNFIEGMPGEQIKAQMKPIPMSELIEFNHARPPGQLVPSAEVLIKQGTLTRVNTQLVSTSGKSMMMVNINNTPIYELFALVPDSNVSNARMAATAVHAISKQVDSSTKFRFGLIILSIYNSNATLSQIDALQTQGDLNPGEFSVLHAEVIRNSLLAVHLAWESGMMTRAISGKTLPIGAMRIAAGLNVVGILASALVDYLHVRNYLDSGEYGLVSGHIIGIMSSISTGLAILMRALAIPGAALMAGTAILLILVAALIISCFTKSDIEKWLFQGPWGKTDNEKDNALHSIEKFHLMITLVPVLDLRGENKNLLRHYEHSLLSPIFLDIKGEDEFIVWEIRVRIDTEIFIKCYFITFMPNGPEIVLNPSIDFSQIKSDETGIVWEMRVPRKYFPPSGLIGQLKFEGYDIKSNLLIGKDAYELHHRVTDKTYRYKKVLYEPKG